MTMYILGGSNTAMQNGWASPFSLNVMRKIPVQNLALGATNSVNALTRLMTDVTLREGDVVVWSNATNDALSMTGRAYDPALMLECVERMIRITRDAGARFLPVLMDTFFQHLMVQQADYAQKLLQLCDHYQLELVNIPQAYAAETGTTQIRAEYFLDGLHMAPDSELSKFVGELTEELWQRGGGYPADVPALFVPDGVELEVFDSFDQPDMAQTFDSSMISTQTWLPPVTARPQLREGMRTEIQAICILADPAQGRFKVRAGQQEIQISAVHNFGASYRGLVMMTMPRLHLPQGMFVPEDGQPVEFSWDSSRHEITSDMYLKPAPTEPQNGDSNARIISMLLRHVPRRF